MKKILYITYDGINDPLGQSQVLGYLKNLSKNFEILIISFEKIKNFNNKKYLKNTTIKNIQLPYFNNLFLKICIFILLNLIIFFNFFRGYRIVHFRGFIASAVSLISIYILKFKYIYDFRSFTVDEYWEMKKIKSTIIYNLLCALDRFLIKNSSQLVVLTQSAKKTILSNFKIKNISVIPTSVKSVKNTNIYLKNNLKNIVYLGGVTDPYLFKESLLFFDYVLQIYPDSKLNILTKEKDYVLKQLQRYNKNNYSVRSLAHHDVLNFMKKMDLSIFFIKKTKSRYHCCPTKLGEFLSVGLPVVTNRGIYVSEQIAKKFKSIFFLNYKKISLKNVNKVLLDIKLNFHSSHSFSAHKKYFSIEKAIAQYKEIYINL